ncbi:hypothetical protein CRENBAI_021867 [Crenichthys baileyi]|uniref:Uncharacterized protein n=1 Tax=Crenichthys baileyi TaxID=28760 RepID=A0AAV9RCS1_9TELE
MLAEPGNEQSNMSSRGRPAGVQSAQEDPSPTGTTKKRASIEEESNQGMSSRRREEIRAQQKQRYQHQRRKRSFAATPSGQSVDKDQVFGSSPSRDYQMSFSPDTSSSSSGESPKLIPRPAKRHKPFSSDKPQDLKPCVMPLG